MDFKGFCFLNPINLPLILKIQVRDSVPSRQFFNTAAVIKKFTFSRGKA